MCDIKPAMAGGLLVINRRQMPDEAAARVDMAAVANGESLGRSFQQRLEEGEIFPICATHRRRHEGRRDFREAG